MILKNCMYRTLLAAVALAVSSVAASAETIFVPAGGDIIKAINQSSDGDVIQLEAGLYQPYATIDTIGRPITIRGVIDANGAPISVIDGQLQRRVFRCVNGETSDTVFERLLIANGWDEEGGQAGGGMLNISSSPTLIDCTFTSNFQSAMINNSSSPTLVNCTFRNNSGSSGDGKYLYSGGGMYNGSSSPTLVGCIFEGNYARDGGGMYNHNSSPILTDCTFEGNYASIGSGNGGGMCNVNILSMPALIDCQFYENSAANGGGMANFESAPTLTGGAFKDNSATLSGGGIYVNIGNGSEPVVADCLLCGSTPNQIYGPWEDGGGNTILSDCSACPDEDSDGICDADDQCPGQPDVDSDSDGTVDCLDGCPFDAAKTEPGRCGCNAEETSVRGDFNCDGVFNILDYGTMQAELGICPGDLNLNGVIDGEDLGLLFSYWGTCVP